MDCHQVSKVNGILSAGDGLTTPSTVKQQRNNEAIRCHCHDLEEKDRNLMVLFSLKMH